MLADANEHASRLLNVQGFLNVYNKNEPVRKCIIPIRVFGFQLDELKQFAVKKCLILTVY